MQITHWGDGRIRECLFRPKANMRLRLRSMQRRGHQGVFVGAPVKVRSGAATARPNTNMATVDPATRRLLNQRVLLRLCSVALDDSGAGCWSAAVALVFVRDGDDTVKFDELKAPIAGMLGQSQPRANFRVRPML
jgi:hypothetical protein